MTTSLRTRAAATVAAATVAYANLLARSTAAEAAAAIAVVMAKTVAETVANHAAVALLLARALRTLRSRFTGQSARSGCKTLNDVSVRQFSRDAATAVLPARGALANNHWRHQGESTVNIRCLSHALLCSERTPTYSSCCCWTPIARSRQRLRARHAHP